MQRYGIHSVHLNYKEYLLKLLVSIILFSFIQVAITSFITSIVAAFRYQPTCEVQDNPGIDPSTVISLKTLKEFRIKAREAGLTEITFDELYHQVEKSRSYLITFFVVRFFRFLSSSLQVIWEYTKDIGFTSFWLAAALWSLFDMYLNIQNTISVTFLVEENKRREEHEKQTNFQNRVYLDQLIIGWNVFESLLDGRFKFTIPTEKVIHFTELLKYDEILCERILQTINEPYIPNPTPDPNCPPYMVVPLDTGVHSQFLQKVSNCISENLKSSNYPAWAFRRNPDHPKYEDAIFVITCEKGPNIPTQHTRVWIIFPSQLKLLLKYTDEEIDDKNGPFVVPEDKQNWRIRIKNLRLWALAEFDSQTGERKKATPYKTQVIQLPLD
eukprot:gene2304-2449_t